MLQMPSHIVFLKTQMCDAQKALAKTILEGIFFSYLPYFPTTFLILSEVTYMSYEKKWSFKITQDTDINNSWPM